jgi:hypothetical protein
LATSAIGKGEAPENIPHKSNLEKAFAAAAHQATTLATRSRSA